MKTLSKNMSRRTWAAALGLAFGGILAVQGADTVAAWGAGTVGGGGSTAIIGRNAEDPFVIQAIEPVDPTAPGGRREVPWLGISTDETSEALAAQLGLKPGEGLVISYITEDSPAAKAGLQKNDVLAELDGQMLVHPAQLRKLIQMRKEGDKIKLTYYRAGKQETATVTVGKTTAAGAVLGEDFPWQGNWRELQRHAQVQAGEAMRAAQDALAKAGIDKEKLRIEIKRSMDEVRKSVDEAMRQATNAHRTFGPAMRQYQELARRGMDVDKDATVVVKSHRDAAKSIVRTDDTGTYVIVANPTKRLTAHDREGKLLFDGEIETAEQQAKVPAAVMEKVKPMLEDLGTDKPDTEKAEEESSGT